jgi:deazaflavin-dependent oxidoreductase (nitroreductase family)
MTRYSALRGRKLTAYETAVERFASSRAGAWLFLRVINPIDRRLLPLSRGRLSLAVGAPVGLLQSVGAKTGEVRRTPLLYLQDPGEILLVASNGGNRRHPAWLHNVNASPDVWFLTAEDGWRQYHARIEDGNARAERWARALDLYAGYQRYQQRAHPRQIPVVVLERAGHKETHDPPQPMAARTGPSAQRLRRWRAVCWSGS